MASVVLDASALIALYSSKDINHLWAIGFFKQTLDRELSMNVLNYSECLVHPIRAGKLDQFSAGVAGLGVEVVQIVSSDASSLAQLRAGTGLRMPDVLVLHQAKNLGAAVATTDQQLAKVARDLGIEVFSPAS